jgi:hypothetical protein
MNKLCGISIAMMANKYDYCVKESIISMLPICDYVIVCYVESNDGTLELLKSIKSDKIEILELTLNDWNLYNSCERLSYITNIGIQKADKLGFQYILSLQADEILDPSSFPAIKAALNVGAEGYLCTRINLWKSPYLELSVEHNRLPCSRYISRLAKSCYRAYSDAESIGVQSVEDFVHHIKIWHMGFVRKREVMKSKIINMQVGVFSMSNYDSKLDQCELFNPDLWFDPKNDLTPITGELPIIIQEWAKERVYN